MLIAGIVVALRIQNGRRGKMAFVTLDDGDAQAEVVVFNETFDAARSLLREDQLVIVEAKITPRMGEDGELQGLRIVGRGGLRPARAAPAPRPRSCASPATAAPTPSACTSCSLRSVPACCPIVVEYRNHGVTGELELPDDVAGHPRRDADRAARRVAGAGERARRLLNAGRPRAAGPSAAATAGPS